MWRTTIRRSNRSTECATNTAPKQLYQEVYYKVTLTEKPYQTRNTKTFISETLSSDL
jgi:hypothetical protein